MYCVNCGKELPENARFCLYCGTKVNSIVEAKPQVSNEEILMNHFVNTIPFVYDNLIECKGYPYIYGYINGKVGLIDANDASMIIPCQYDEINPYFIVTISNLHILRYKNKVGGASLQREKKQSLALMKV